MTLRLRSAARVYELGHRVAVGGMGEIYEGVAADLARQVAIKRVLRSDDSPDLKALFLREVAVAATLEHPNVVEVIDAGMAGGDLYLVMEFVDGPSLAEVLESMRRAGKRLPIEIVCGLMAQIARGLAHAHERSLPDGTSLGILHRDVAPENVLLTRSGLPKLADFGLATLQGQNFTTPGTIRGRPRCLSPEQARGDPIDVRSDVFALGAMMFELVTGQQLYPNEPLATLLFKVANGDYEPIAPRVPNADEDLIAILQTACAVDPQERFRSARELERSLDAFRAARGLRVDSGSIAKLIAQLGVSILRIRGEKREEGPGELEGRRLVLPPDRLDTTTGGIAAARDSVKHASGQTSGDLPSNPFYDAPTAIGGARAPEGLQHDHLFDPSALEPAPRVVDWRASGDIPVDSPAPEMHQAPQFHYSALDPPSGQWSDGIPKPAKPAKNVAGDKPRSAGENEVAWLVFLGIVLAAAVLAFASIWLRDIKADQARADRGVLVLPKNPQ